MSNHFQWVRLWFPPFFPLLLFQFQLLLPKSQTSSVSMGMEEGCLSFSIPNICLYKQLCTGGTPLSGLRLGEEVLCLSGGSVSSLLLLRLAPVLDSRSPGHWEPWA
jgi:hypothetical protein